MLNKGVRPTVLLIALALVLTSAQASMGKSAPNRQKVEGSIVQSMNSEDFCDDAPEGHLQYASNGVWPTGLVAHRFDVAPETFGKFFKLKWSGAADLDIRFYDMDGVGIGEVPPYVEYQHRGAGPEVGWIPDGYDLAIVCMFEGANQPFTYTGGLRAP